MKKTLSQGSRIDNLLKRQHAVSAKKTPFVSVVCPTWNRREFLPYLLYIYQYQDYPADKRELIILDDSERSNQDLIEMMLDGTQENVRYIHSPERLTLGKKRNMLNELAAGEYIISFDDDDYYPPNKISYQVGEMLRHRALFSGCDQIYIWYSHLDKIYLTHKFGNKHALNGTFGLHRNVLKKHRYQDNDTFAEEQAFLKNYTTPVLQIAPEKSIICISHNANTCDKDLIMWCSTPVDLRLEDLIEDQNLLAHYRRLSHAPLNTQVAWSAFEKVAVIYDPQKAQLLASQCQAFIEFGFAADQLIPVALLDDENPDIAEWKTYSAIVEQAQSEGWSNVLLLDAAANFVKKEHAVRQVNALLNQLPHIDWQGVALGGKYHQLTIMQSLKGVARIRKGERICAFAVNANFYSALRDALCAAIHTEQSGEQMWSSLFAQHCCLGFYPSFSFLQHITDRQSGEQIDCTHWFFQKQQ